LYYLAIMARQPIAGQAKTRLCPPLRPNQAAELYEAFVMDLLDTVRRIEYVTAVIAYTPNTPAAEAYFAQLAPDMDRMPQPEGALGERLATASETLFARGGQRVGVIGSDLPGLPATIIAEGFTRLDHADLAIGPSEDGGYYLAVLKRPVPELYRDVTMSTPRVLHDTLRVAARLGLRVAQLSDWADVDTPSDLARLRIELANDPSRAPHTAALLGSLR
jgi:rSAM/selenodomain-associated transferase 1